MRKKILIHNGSLRLGGIERRLIEFLENLDLSKFDITLVVDDNFGELDVFRKRLPREVKLIYLKSEKMLQVSEWLRRNKKNVLVKIGYNLAMTFERKFEEIKFKKIVSEEKYEVILDFDTGLSRHIEKIAGPRKIARQFNSITSLYKGDTKRIKRYGERLKKYDTIIAICDDMKGEIESLYPELKGKVIRIYNSFDIEAIRKNSQKKESLSVEEKEKVKEKYILSVSRLDNVQKDYYTLLKAMKIVKEAGEKIKLYIAGEGPGRLKIEEWIDELKLRDQVELLGYQSNPHVWLANSEFFVHSSRYEGLPGSLVEAMICEKVIVSSDCPTGPNEILRGGECGVLLKIGDSEGFAEAILKLLKDDGLKKEFLNISHDRVKSFDKNIVTLEMEELLLSN